MLRFPGSSNCTACARGTSSARGGTQREQPDGENYGELLFSKAFGWTLNGNSSAAADAVVSTGCAVRSNADVGLILKSNMPARRP